MMRETAKGDAGIKQRRALVVPVARDVFVEHEHRAADDVLARECEHCGGALVEVAVDVRERDRAVRAGEERRDGIGEVADVKLDALRYQPLIFGWPSPEIEMADALIAESAGQAAEGVESVPEVRRIQDEMNHASALVDSEFAVKANQ